MFVGFPSTQTPAVQWWDYSKTNSGTINIALTNDCAPVQFFATGGSSTTIIVTLPLDPPQGKVITIKNEKYGPSSQSVRILDGTYNSSSVVNAVLGVAAEATYCYIGQNNIVGTANTLSNWIRIAGGSTYTNSYALSIGGYDNDSTGSMSTAIGGFLNIASGAQSICAGGQLATASGSYSATLGGSSATASSSYSATLGGDAPTASGQGSACLAGVSVTSSGLRSIAGGDSSTSNASYSFVYGVSASAQSRIGNVVFSGNQSPYSTGLRQVAMLALGAETTDATATVLRSNTGVAGTTNQITIANNSAYYFRGECVAAVTGAGNTKGWYIEGVIKRGANAASTVLVGTPTVTSNYADAGASTWNLTATADTTNGALAITATGQAATTIRWLCQIRTTEMGF